MRVLVYHNGALGDAITIIPCLRMLKAALSPADITLIGNPAVAPLLRGYGLIRDFLDATSSSLASLFSPEPPAPLRALLGSFELALLFSASEPLIRAVTSAVPSTLHHQPFPARHVSVYGYHARFLAEPLAARCPHAPSALLEAALRPPLLGARPPRAEPCLLIHPGSSNRVKTWPLERFLAVAASLRGRGLRVTWSFGPADATPDAVRATADPGDEILHNATPSELAHRLQNARLYIGVDSGVSHLAAAVGCPSVVIFGPTSAEVWRPPGDHVRLVVRRSECGRGGSTPCQVPPRGEQCAAKENGIARCILAVGPQDVLRVADELLVPPPP